MTLEMLDNRLAAPIGLKGARIADRYDGALNRIRRIVSVLL